MKRFTAALAAMLAALGLALAGPTLAQKTEAPKADAAKAQPKADAKAQPMDINTATAKELASLPGIGEARAEAIIKGRPYRGKNEIKDRKIVPAKVYDDIQDKIIARQK
jgi:competence protein ComEA